ncbi:MAG: dinitrogenase iron-molybdenum cofactor biosynthesis protein [Dehalococcoidia bacterium]|nr:dinitrogenase iron-molybdenum cofactor biosynthesis protein [Dehalococcoidia bacterium]
MKIAISATGTNLDAELDPRFGRCQYFIIVDPDTMQFEAVANESATASGGAGISAAQMIAAKGVAAVLTGNCGPNASQVLYSAGIKIITSVSGKVKDAVQSYESGALQPSTPPDASGGPGGFTPGTGGGRGMGRGMGKRCGRGGGSGMGGGMGKGRGGGRGMGGGMMPPA